MLTSLFSIFDPTLSFLNSSLLSPFFIIMFIWPSFWPNNFVLFFYGKFLAFLKMEVDYVVLNPSMGVYKYVSFIFISIFFYNFFAIFPYFFSMTSHFFSTFPLSFGLWFSVIFFVWGNYFFSFLSHLIPVGTPIGLMSFMVLVELMSNFIRPIALTFRLTANMMAGHLLMSIIGGSFLTMSLPFLVSGGLVQSLLVSMELGVSVIQAYVFSVLLMLYMTEVSS